MCISSQTIESSAGNAKSINVHVCACQESGKTRLEMLKYSRWVHVHCACIPRKWKNLAGNAKIIMNVHVCACLGSGKTQPEMLKLSMHMHMHT